jgi:DNA-binding transcriptional regulator YiaG
MLARRALGLTRAQLAERLQTTRQTILRWETGFSPISGPATVALRGLLAAEFPQGQKTS